MTREIEEGDREGLDSPSEDSSVIDAERDEPGLNGGDDLAALLSRASLNESQYREFAPQRRQNGKTRSEDSPQDRASGAGRNESVATVDRDAQAPNRERFRSALTSETEKKPFTSRGSSRVEGVARPGAKVHASGRSLLPGPSITDQNSAKSKVRTDGAQSGRRKFDSTIESRWPVLGRALSGETEKSPGRLVQALANSVSLPFALVSSVCGGTGVTTILATLARCLASEGERVLLVDAGSVSLFPLYFGAGDPGDGELQNFLMPDSSGSVSTVNRRELERAAPASARLSGDSERTGLVATILSAASGSDRMLLDSGALRASDVQTLQPGKQVGLIPLVPDISCVFGLLKIEKALKSRKENEQDSGSVFYVLNKFDGSLALYRDIKASLEAQLGDRLLPIALRRSNAVAEALADGMTVIDYCPEAGVTEDFLRLADWVREVAPVARRDRNE